MFQYPINHMQAYNNTRIIYDFYTQTFDDAANKHLGGRKFKDASLSI